MSDIIAREVAKKIEDAESARKHTQDWYAAHYGKLQDWARTRLPEPWVTEFFNCVANGTWHHSKDVGEPYMSVGAGMITPSGYFKMETAAQQLLADQTRRAEEAEIKLEEYKPLREQLEAKWITVAERMPEYDTDVCLWSQDWGKVYIGYWRHSEEWIGRFRPEDNKLPDTNPTHWCALPEPPKEILNGK